jgi:NAD(P)-dependent dehydrogenase (short-subunit alcohol dehydrogenase family)
MDAVAAAAGALDGLVLSAAPPPLGMRLTSTAGPELAAYVADSVRRAAVPLGAFLPGLCGPRPWVVVCSSVALDAPPAEWPHYVAAKGALEALGRWVAEQRRDVRVVILRAPKMRTDFTSTPGGAVGAADPAAVAAWLVERIAAGLPEGLSVLEPPA